MQSSARFRKVETDEAGGFAMLDSLSGGTTGRTAGFACSGTSLLGSSVSLEVSLLADGEAATCTLLECTGCTRSCFPCSSVTPEASSSAAGEAAGDVAFSGGCCPCSSVLLEASSLAKGEAAGEAEGANAMPTCESALVSQSEFNESCVNALMSPSEFKDSCAFVEESPSTPLLASSSTASL